MIKFYSPQHCLMGKKNLRNCEKIQDVFLSEKSKFVIHDQYFVNDI